MLAPLPTCLLISNLLQTSLLLVSTSTLPRNVAITRRLFSPPRASQEPAKTTTTLGALVIARALVPREAPIPVFCLSGNSLLLETGVPATRGGGGAFTVAHILPPLPSKLRYALHCGTDFPAFSTSSPYQIAKHRAAGKHIPELVRLLGKFHSSNRHPRFPHPS